MGSNDKKNRAYSDQMRCIEIIDADIIALQEAAFEGGYQTSYVPKDTFISDMVRMGYVVYMNEYDKGRLHNVLAIKRHMKPDFVSKSQGMGGTNIVRVKDLHGNDIYIVSIHLNLNRDIAEPQLLQIAAMIYKHKNVIMLGDFNNEKDKLIKMGMPPEFKSYSTRRTTGLKRKKIIDHIWFKGNIEPSSLPGETDTLSHTFHKVISCNSSQSSSGTSYNLRAIRCCLNNTLSIFNGNNILILYPPII